MNFIVDAQLPKALSDWLKTLGYDSVHTLELPSGNKTQDKAILDFATLEERVVITKDRDFLDSHLVRKDPRKLILVRTGNIRNSALMELFSKNITNIIGQLVSADLLEITSEELIVHK